MSPDSPDVSPVAFSPFNLSSLAFFASASFFFFSSFLASASLYELHNSSNLALVTVFSSTNTLSKSAFLFSSNNVARFSSAPIVLLIVDENTLLNILSPFSEPNAFTNFA